MAGTQTQLLPVPDYVVTDPPVPTPSPVWVPAVFETLVRVGLGTSTEADVVVVLGAATNADPITTTNPNQLATLYGGAAVASVPPEPQGLSACTFFAFLRLPPTFGTGAPTIGLPCQMQGI
jgi:hypothetical protein